MGRKKDSENIRVVIRCRNLLPYELERGDEAFVRLDLATQQIVVQHPIGDPEAHAFDAVYNNTFTQRDVFLQEVKPLVEAVLQGYNATVFAYGQSGSGKTYTMTGNLNNSQQWGMMPQVVDYLFTEIKKMTTSTKQFKVKVSYVELYNGKSRDLLSENHQVNLEIKQNMSKNFFVKGAEMPQVMGFDDCVRLFKLGTDRRQTASTDLNDQSSRSHSLFSLTVEQYDFDQDPSSPVILTSKINVVDLAGSEKLSKTNATGDTVKEGCNINLSLTALAHVIDKIVKGEKHIPFRGSPLTMLLKDSLGGNAKTVMFANVGPSDRNVSETVSTIRFALRAKQIQNKPIKNIDPKDARIQELMEKIEQLQKRLGGKFDPGEEENLAKRVEELECENAELKGLQNKDLLELEELMKAKEAQIEQLSVHVRDRDRDFQGAQERCQLVESNLRSEADHSSELKSLMSNFIRRVCTSTQLLEMRKKMPDDGTYNTSEEGWDLRELQWYLEGFVGFFEEARSNAISEEDVKRHVNRVREDLEGQLQRYQVDVQREREEYQRQREEECAKRASESEAASQLKVECAAAKEESARLRVKIERDHEKFKHKLEKMKEAHHAVSAELEIARVEVGEAQRDVEKLKKLNEETASKNTTGLHASMNMGFLRSGGGDEKLVAALEEERKHRMRLEAQLKETTLLLRRRGLQIRRVDEDTTAGAPPESSEDASESLMLLSSPEDSSAVDQDALSLLQQQIRVQHRLQELRHQHQRKLDDMVRKYELLKTGTVTPIAAPEVPAGVSEEVLEARIAEALQAKTEEMAVLEAEHEKQMNKLVRKLNKKVEESQEAESNWNEERTQLEEERAELTAANEELTRLHQQLLIELGTVRDELRYAKSTEEGTLRLKDGEIAHLKGELAAMIKQVDTFKVKAEDLEHVTQECTRLQQQNQRAEGALREKIDSLEGSRQKLIWSNTQLETEQRRAQKLEEQIRQHDQLFKAQEERWNARLIENDNKMALMNNKRLEELTQSYQALVDEEKQKNKGSAERFRKARAATHKAMQRFDEMVLEHESIKIQLEDEKVASMKYFREKQEAQRELEALQPKAVGYRKF